MPMCHALYVLLGEYWETVVSNWTYYITQPWKQCTKQKKCYWYCLCCNKWLCWIGLIIVAVIVIFILTNYLIVLICTLIFCETLCVLRVYLLGEQRVGCFNQTPPSSGPPPPPPPPPMGSGSGTGNQPR